MAAVGLQLWSYWQYSSLQTLQKPLGQLVPKQLRGWIVRDLPIAYSKEAIAWTENILRYDDAVYRQFERAGIYLSIYAAYWLPGKKSYASVGLHNPDSCWINTGWKRQERVYGHQRKVGEQWLKPYEFGRYRKEGNETAVIFWHLVGGQVNRYKQELGWRSGIQGRIERLPLILKDWRQYGLDQRREQLFIRIASNVPMEQLWSNPAFIHFIQSLKPLGIFDS